MRCGTGLELGGVQLGEVVEGEGPGLEARAEGHSAIVGEHLHATPWSGSQIGEAASGGHLRVTESLVVVGCDDDVGVLEDLDKVLVGVLMQLITVYTLQHNIYLIIL